MREKCAGLLLLFLLVGSYASAASVSEAQRKPMWSEVDAPEVMRGRYMADRLKAADGYSYVVTGISDPDKIRFNGQEIEVKAWRGVQIMGSKYTWRAKFVETPRIVVPANWSILLACMALFTLIYPFTVKQKWSIYFAFCAPLLGLGAAVLCLNTLGPYGRERASEAFVAFGKVVALPAVVAVIGSLVRKKFDLQTILAAVFFSFGLTLTALPALEHYTFSSPVPIGDIEVVGALAAVVSLFVVLPGLLKPAVPNTAAVAQPAPVAESPKA